MHSAPDGCICDGSGWTERRETHAVHVLVAGNVEEREFEDVVMVRCPACASVSLQRRLAEQSGLLASELELSLDDVVPNGHDTALMLAMAREFCREPWGMWTLWGTFGNAKTLFLQAVVNHFRRHGELSVYVRFSDLLDYVRAGFDPERHIDPDTGEPDDNLARYRRLMKVRFLAVDELDKARLTAYAYEFQSAFLDDRWRYGVERDPAVRRHTLIAMNDDPAGLPGNIYDRLRDGRFGAFINGVWKLGITRNMDTSMRPAMERQP